MAIGSREIELLVRLVLIVFFGGMSLLFWVANRREDRKREQILREMDLRDAANPVAPKDVTPLAKLQADYFTLFRLSENPSERGTLLVDVFNRLFAMWGLSVNCPFEKRVDEAGNPIDEQIDGVIELDSNLYLIEVHWDDRPVGQADIQEHLDALSCEEDGSPKRGVVVSFSGFTDLAIDAAKAAVKAGHVIILCTLADFTHILEGEGHVDAFLRTRLHIAAIDKNPYASYVVE